ncbi:MAG: hypothetical protein LBS36_04975 [Oscillospiraceae bacterium]|jgi:hypothetical protein|nr:hypothetical protein [Oscillospiraceae bacterium]
MKKYAYAALMIFLLLCFVSCDYYNTFQSLATTNPADTLAYITPESLEDILDEADDQLTDSLSDKYMSFYSERGLLSADMVGNIMSDIFAFRLSRNYVSTSTGNILAGKNSDHTIFYYMKNGNNSIDVLFVCTKKDQSAYAKNRYIFDSTYKKALRDSILEMYPDYTAVDFDIGEKAIFALVANDTDLDYKNLSLDIREHSDAVWFFADEERRSYFANALVNNQFHELLKYIKDYTSKNIIDKLDPVNNCIESLESIVSSLEKCEIADGKILLKQNIPETENAVVFPFFSSGFTASETFEIKKTPGLTLTATIKDLPFDAVSSIEVVFTHKETVSPTDRTYYKNAINIDKTSNIVTIKDFDIIGIDIFGGTILFYSEEGGSSYNQNVYEYNFTQADTANITLINTLNQGFTQLHDAYYQWKEFNEE